VFSEEAQKETTHLTTGKLTESRRNFTTT